MPEESSRKRVATSPLSSEFDKRSRLGLTDEELRDLNENLRLWIQPLKGHPDYAPMNPEEISTRVIAQTFQQIILNLLDTSRASTVDKSWKKVNYGEGRINLLAREDQLQLASIWIEARDKGDWERFASQPQLLQIPKQDAKHFISEERRAATEKLLYHAYTQPFRGQNATQFLDFLIKTDANVREGRVVYAKSVSIVQSSGTGKSRMLTKIGKQIFTLPVCLRGPEDPGYPLGDCAVYDYFSHLHNDNDLSISAHAAIARFLGAAHKTMLKWLKEAQTTHLAEELPNYWHDLIEGPERTEREIFFGEVVKVAREFEPPPATQPSPRRNQNLQPDIPGFDLHKYSDYYYDRYVKQATQDLASFACSITPQRPIVVTYFDEAHVLDESFWSMLRLLSRQDVATSMLYVFADTKSTISDFNPAIANRRSVKLRLEGIRLLPPYIAIGFDQIVIAEDRGEVVVKMGELQSIKHLAKYGRPMWNAQYVEGEDDEQIKLAADKLICRTFMEFDPKDRDQVLAVLSQRICVDTVLFASEALQLAERSVASHMRLLTGFAPDGQTFFTYSPSEPMLALAAAKLLYNSTHDVLGQVLDTFSKNLCGAGVVEKGLLGELAGRTLLTVARDLAAPKEVNGFSPNLLTPVLVMDFLDELFGNTSWCGPHREELRKAFEGTYVNFTHWMVTKDPLPERPSQKLLANLWARGAALQCCVNQESLDLQIVTYKGSIAPDAVFNIKNLSVSIIQIKNKSSADANALRLLRPVGLARDLYEPLPYLAIVMELGTDTPYQGHEGPIRITVSSGVPKDAFQALWVAWEKALGKLEKWTEAKKAKKAKKGQMKKLIDNVKTTRAAVDAYNRYTVNIRGASDTTYGLLKKANIVTQFATLIKVTMPSPTAPEDALQHMRPLERLGKDSAYTAWMTDYGEGETTDSEDDNGDPMLDQQEEENKMEIDLANQ